MPPISRDAVIAAVDLYGRCWTEQDPSLLSQLFTTDAIYIERIFDSRATFRGLEAIQEYWRYQIVGKQSNIAFRHVVDEMVRDSGRKIAVVTRVLPEDAGQLARPLQSLPDEQRSYLLPRALQTALSRFEVTNSVQFATEAVNNVCDTENDRLDSELSMVRYITWAIPSIGFIGTVRGIGAALGQAHEAMQGDIAGVTSSLGVAFNSTFIALLISMVVMFFMHQLQLIQERLVLDSHAYCEHKLLRFLKAPK